VLLEQLASQSARLRQEFNLDLRIRGILGSQRMLLAPSGVDLNSWRDSFDAQAVVADINRFAEHVHADFLPHTVFIDCTASESVTVPAGPSIRACARRVA
jgi:aspartokinase/homoserine dehydrogenase 1